ncbi:hypothetical protein GCM10027202_36390 [Microvirgula curvata]
MQYQAVVGVLGKTGAGKSSLCNALFGQETASVSDVEACTRHPQEITLSNQNGKGLSLLDVPDVGESTACDANYTELYASLMKELERSVEKYNSERHLAHIPNVELVKSDFTQTAAQYLEANPHTIISLLYLDFDLYEPTKKALELFLLRMPKGADRHRKRLARFFTNKLPPRHP